MERNNGDLIIEYGDTFTVTTDPYDRELPAILVENRNHGVDERYLRVTFTYGLERETKINELIRALEQLRDHEPSAEYLATING